MTFLQILRMVLGYLTLAVILFDTVMTVLLMRIVTRQSKRIQALEDAE